MAEQISILEIKNTEKLKAALQELLARADRNTPNILRQAGQVGVGFCKIECPVDLGHLRASIGNPRKEGIFDVTRNAVAFGTAVKYAFPVEFGTTSYWIRPKPPKGYLAWKGAPVAQKIKFKGGKVVRGAMQYRSKTGRLVTTKKLGEWIYTKKPVKHPAMKGKHFMLKGVQKAVPKMIEVLKGILRG